MLNITHNANTDRNQWRQKGGALEVCWIQALLGRRLREEMMNQQEEAYVSVRELSWLLTIYGSNCNFRVILEIIVWVSSKEWKPHNSFGKLSFPFFLSWSQEWSCREKVQFFDCNRWSRVFLKQGVSTTPVLWLNTIVEGLEDWNAQFWRRLYP